jgi:hypothetical protein
VPLFRPPKPYPPCRPQPTDSATPLSALSIRHKELVLTGPMTYAPSFKGSKNY